MATALKFHADILVDTENLSYEEWLTQRSGGSDLAAICGISKWRTPVHVYLEKLGGAPEEHLSAAAEWGTRLEPLIADKFASEHPEWAIIEKKVIYCHSEHRWAFGNLNRMIIYPKRGRGILEIKTASEYLRQEWDDGNIPDYYYVQLQWYMFVTGLDWGYFDSEFGERLAEITKEHISLTKELTLNGWYMTASDREIAIIRIESLRQERDDIISLFEENRSDI